jgi:hypothetical protein
VALRFRNAISKKRQEINALKCGFEALFLARCAGIVAIRPARRTYSGV